MKKFFKTITPSLESLATGPLDPFTSVGNLLAEKKLTIAVAESCTGGLLSHMITNAPGSSAYFDSAVICYSPEAKVRLLGLSEKLIRKYGTVSPETAKAMSKAVRKLRNVKIGLAVTGTAGPDSQENKPVGLVYIALSYGRLTYAGEFRFKGGREKIKKQAANAAIKLLWKHLNK